MKKVAFSDFDGTLAKGYISMEFMDFLHNKGIYSREAYAKQGALFQEHKTGNVSYDRWVEKWALLWAEGLKGREEKEVKNAALEFFKSFEPNIYKSSYELVKLLKGKGYCTVAISVGAMDIIRIAGKRLGFDKIYATEPEKSHGIFTGNLKTRLHLPSGKQEIIAGILHTGKFRQEGSFAFGDSASDAGMLGCAEQAIALNPNKELIDMAKKNSWRTASYKNVINIVRQILQS